MKRCRHPFFAVLLSLLLLTSQQAAFAHLLSHLPDGAKATTQYQNDHGSLDGAADTCTTCIAFAGVGGGAPPSSAANAINGVSADNVHLPVVALLASQPPASYRARAPPVFL